MPSGTSGLPEGLSWYPFAGGSTLGQEGSERGFTIRDEEHPLGARITLEKNTQSAPFAITCGIYGCMVHTRFLGDEHSAISEYDAMRLSLSTLLQKTDEAGDRDEQILLDGVAGFVNDYP